MSNKAKAQSSTNIQEQAAPSSRAPFSFLTHDNSKVKKRGKYLKKALMVICYGASVKRTARTSKLGLRRTNVLAKSLGLSNAIWSHNNVSI